MAIYEGSRYEFAPLIRVLTAFDEVLPALYQDPRLLDQHFRFRRYVWRDGDRIDLVAHNFLGDPERWWRLMHANPEITDPDNITEGTTLRIPSD